MYKDSDVSEKSFNLNEKPQELFERMKDAEILATEEEFHLEKLENCLYDVFKEYGEKSLEENNEKIFMSLSGGLDSTLCLAFLRKIFPEKEIVTFTIGGSEQHPDVVHSRIASEKFKTEHNELIPTAQEINDTLMEYKEKFGDELKEATETGDFDTFLLYKYISKFKPKVLLSHDGIDELMGGYPEHRWNDNTKAKEEAFKKYWEKLVPEHLDPLVKTGKIFDIDILYPYIDDAVIEIVSKIPLDLRTTKEVSKKPLKDIAKNLGVPNEIIERKKEGRVGALYHFKK